MTNTAKRQHFCEAKFGEPSRMRVCGQPIEYLDEQAAKAEGFRYSGWYHVMRDVITDHHAVKL